MKNLFDLDMIHKEKVSEDSQYIVDILLICMVKGK